MSRWAAAVAAIRRLPNPVKVIGGLGALVRLILGVMQLYNKVFPPPKPAQRSVLFIVDSSSEMRAPFDGRDTKLDAVKQEILRFVRNQPDVLVGLRFVGNICTEGYQKPAVVGQGANDFLHYSRAGKAQSPSMWVFFGGIADPCGTSGLADEIATDLHDVKLQARFDFFAIRKTLAGRKELVRLVSKLKQQGHDAKWLQPRNRAQLRRVVATVASGEQPSDR